MSILQTLIALVVLIFVLSVIVQAAQEGLKSLLSMKADTMAKTLQKFMGDHLTLQQVQSALHVRGLDITALEHFNKEDFRHLLDGIELAAPQVQGVVASANATIDEAKNNIAGAYEAARAAFQKAYTTKNKLFAVLLSFVVVLALNASIVKIYETLAADQALTQAIAGTVPAMTNASNSAQGAVTANMSPQTLNDVYSTINKDLKDYPVLLRTGVYARDWAEGPWEEILGLLVMGLLVSLGAPFWNDVLKGVTGVNAVLNANARKTP